MVLTNTSELDTTCKEAVEAKFLGFRASTSTGDNPGIDQYNHYLSTGWFYEIDKNLNARWICRVDENNCVTLADVS